MTILIILPILVLVVTLIMVLIVLLGVISIILIILISMIIIVVISLKGKIVLFLEFDHLTIIFEVDSSSHPTSLLKSQKKNRNMHIKFHHG